MSFSQGDVVWLRIDNLEGGLGTLHPCVVISGNAFNDSREWGILIRGSHSVPTVLFPEEYVIRRNAQNGLDKDTVFGSIIFGAKWERVTKLVGNIPPVQIAELINRLRAILEI